MQLLLINNIRNIAVMVLQTRESLEGGVKPGAQLLGAVKILRYQVGLLDAVLKGSQND